MVVKSTPAAAVGSTAPVGGQRRRGCGCRTSRSESRRWFSARSIQRILRAALCRAHFTSCALPLGGVMVTMVAMALQTSGGGDDVMMVMSMMFSTCHVQLRP